MARTTNVESFKEFLEGYLDELLTAKQRNHESQEEDLKDLIARVLFHDRQYDEKSLISQQNVFFLFSPSWLTPLECSFLWIVGFKSRILFDVAKGPIDDLSHEQKERLSELAQETKVEERVLNDNMAKFQESVAAPSLLELVRRQLGRLEDEEQKLEKEALGSLGRGVQAIVDRANFFRTSSVMKVVDS